MSRIKWCRALALLAGLACAGFSGLALSQTGPTLPLLIGSGGASNNFSVPVHTLLFFTALSFIPAIVLMMTGFTRIVIVLSLLRQALGTQAVPPNQVIIGLSLFLTFFVMGPTFDKVYKDAWKPYIDKSVSFEQAAANAEQPMREFMLRQTRQSDLALFARLDLVVASILMSLGMMMISPVLVALPFKLMLFVLADGWNLLLGSLAASFK